MNHLRWAARAARPAALLVFAGALAACGGGSTMTGAACLPEPARQWLADAPAAQAAAAAGGPVDLYVDASGSMVGYLRGATDDRRPFQDLLAQLRAATAAGPEANVQRSYRLFGRTIRDLPAARADTLVQPDTYLCPAGAEGCDNQESRLDLVMRRIAQAPANSLSVVVTDLWLSTSELEASGPVAVGAPVAEMLAQGRALGVLGVAAPYAGRIYDLPSGATIERQGDRPLYVLLIGPTERVVAFRENLARAGLRGYGADARWSLFTADPSTGASAGQVQAAGGAFQQRAFLPPAAGIRAPQFVLSTDRSLRERLDASATPSSLTYTASTDGIRPGAVWRGPQTGVTRVYRLNGDPCAPNAWVPLQDLTEGWSGDTFELAAAQAATRLPRGGTYLLVGELRRTGLEIPSPANAWMRQWSFNASTEGRVLEQPPAVFPTLNLAETAQILEAAAEQAARRRPVTLAGFTAVVRSEG